ncbi:MAG: hypothetical protein IJN60_00850 [Oscillospiraceae bacterium]|nr:hypothetical protein [Oscillospiraceae bacterium]
MELYKEILAHALAYRKIQFVFPFNEEDILKIAEGICYQTLQKIKAVIEDDSLADKECFYKIEEIVCALEDIGCVGLGRHDFG